MKIVGHYSSLSEIPQSVKNRVQEGRWYHFRRVTLIQTEKEITAVALNALERFAAVLWKLFRSNYFAHILKAKKAEVIEPSTLTIKPPVQPQPVGLAATGGMENGILACFLITTLQALKALPSFMEAVHKKTLTRGKAETVEKFQLRKDIQRQIGELLKISGEGKTVPREKVTEFHKMISQYSPSHFTPGQMGDFREAFYDLHEILEFSSIYHKVGGVMGPTKWYQLIYQISTLKDFYGNFIEKDDFGNSPEIFTVFINHWGPGLNSGGSNSTFQIEPQDKLALKCNGKVVNYRLASFARNVSNYHAKAYLKDNGKWIEFDDARVTPLAELTPEHKKISMLFYQKV